MHCFKTRILTELRRALHGAIYEDAFPGIATTLASLMYDIDLWISRGVDEISPTALLDILLRFENLLEETPGTALPQLRLLYGELIAYIAG